MYDAIIAGAGPAGSTAARLLARAGWSVLLLEKSQFPRRKVCGEFISATSIPLLPHGCRGAELPFWGPEIRRVGFFAADVATNADMPIPAGAPDRFGRAFPREHLDSALCRSAVAAGAELRQQTTVIAARRDERGFAVTAERDRSQEVIFARTMIVAAGSWQRSGFAAIDAPHRASDLFAFKAHFRQAELATDLMPLMIFPGGYGGMVHSGGGAVTVSFCIRRDVLDRCRKSSPGSHAAEAALHHIVRHNRGVREVLGNATRDGAWLATGPIRPGIRKCFDNGMFCAGNAAGEAHPLIAEGISMAIQSAWLLCESLLGRSQSPPDSHEMSLRGAIYSSQWRRAFAPRIRAAAAFAQVAMRPAASAAAPLVRAVPSLLRIGARLSGKSAALPGYPDALREALLQGEGPA